MPPPSTADVRSRPDPACADQGWNAVGVGCTTRRQNTHGIEEREVLYPWHPWAGRLARVNEVVERKGGDVFRCVCRERSMDVVQDLPSWMFDRAACATVRILMNPLVDLAALRVLRALLNNITKDRALAQSPPSNTPFLDATLRSHDQNRGETHARPATSSSSTSERDTAVRSIRGSRRRTAAKTRLGHAADADPPGADGSHGAIDPRSQRERTRAPSEGDAS